jgi:imidazolonepropionase-like amidohydrolase
MSLGNRLAVWLAVSLAAGATTPAPAQDLVLRGATVIDGTDRAPRQATVVVRNGWITAVGPDSAAPAPRGARVIDLRGRYLVPGFIEMHGHVAIGAWEIDSSGPRRALRYAYDELASRELTRSQLAFGITTVRNPAAPTAEGVSLRNRVRTGELVGPRIITSGAPLDAPGPNTAIDPVGTEAEARAAVDRQAAAGVDFIKLYAGLDSSLVAAAVDQAHKHGLRAVGHLWKTSWTDAAEAGIDGITHIIVNNAKLLPAGKREPYEKSITNGLFMYDWFGLVDFDGPEIAEMLQALVANRVTIDPTLVAFEMTAWYDDSTHYPKEADQYVPPTFLAKWASMNALRGWTAADYARARSHFPRMLELARRLHEAGVPLTVGVDGANPWLFHRELELLVEAGIPSADVIRMATRNGAIGLGLTSEIGTVEVGKRADLVVLDADPIADIRNSRRISWVIVGGKPARPAAYLPERLTRRSTARRTIAAARLARLGRGLRRSLGAAPNRTGRHHRVAPGLQLGPSGHPPVARGGMSADGVDQQLRRGAEGDPAAPVSDRGDFAQI